MNKKSSWDLAKKKLFKKQLNSNYLYDQNNHAPGQRGNRAGNFGFNVKEIPPGNRLGALWK